MKAISLKIREDIFEELEKTVKEVRMSRNAYINKAVDLFNKMNRKRRIRKLLRDASLKVRDQSLEFLRETEVMDEHLWE
ncbi:MAG: hypothetical protein HQL15_07170 [Candidatus Omnitrophica bacterium]|nr:hypothetical protein [Candidatus Omnitrophota bacterium]